MKKIALISFASGLLMPVVALAQSADYVNYWLDAGTDWLGRAITIIMVLLTIWFLVNVFRYVSEKEAAKLGERRKVMLNSLIGLFVAVSVWGIINIAGRVVGTRNQNDAAPIVCPPGSRPINGSCEVFR